MTKSAWLLSAGALALAAPAWAQDNTQNTGVTSPLQESAEVDPNQDVTPTDEVVEENNAGEIIVTAQGRRQVLQDVPIAVSAVSAESLQNSGATDIRQLNQLAPSLLVSSTGSEANGSARIRGIGTVGDNPGLESSVAVFIDGVYRSRTGVGLNELGEIERIEVLRGPQGTLFGRNASAGLINIISKKPNLNRFEGFAEGTYGNYDFMRLSGGLTGPIGASGLGFRVDGVLTKRDGFYNDINNDTDVNDRDRYFVRGQLLYEPIDTLELRFIADYTKRDEKCCGAVYVDRSITPLIGGLNDPAQNNIIRVLIGLGQDPAAFSNPFSRNIYVTPGRGFGGETEDWGVSFQADWTLGFGTLTSITGYRDYDARNASDTDYGTVDILFRAEDGLAGRQFQTFSQELRLQGSAFNERLDWLVGGYYADEDLTASDNIRFGTQYGRFANCRIISAGGLAGFFAPNQPNCATPTGRAILARFGPAVANGFNLLDSLNDRGTTQDRYFQNSRNYAFFTHNIVHITDTLNLTLGLRYTNERKKFEANFGNDNVICPQLQGSLIPSLSSPNATVRALAGALIGLGCQGNSTAELNGVMIRDRRSEDEFTGTSVLSWKPNRYALFYGSYSRGYKAGGFNLDRSALKSPILPFAAFPGGAQGLVGNLQFDQEINNAYELGMKYSRGPLTVNVAAFRQEFQNFQLNTFNGAVFLVQTINGCTADLGGADRDQSAFPAAPNFNASAGTTGRCDEDDVGYGVLSQGVEIESSIRPSRDITVGLGLTYADTKYRDNLVGNRRGDPLDPALRKLPGDNLSNAPELVFTSSFTWTPDIGTSGLSGLFYVDSRLTSDYNTGSDLFPQKEQDGYVLVNARVGIRGADQRWGIELWAQNLFDQDYAQVAFNSPFQAGGAAPNPAGQPFIDPQFPGGRQIFSAFLAEPRTYGITGRIRF